MEKLADRVAMSPRNFTRVFTRETGVPPARYVAEARLAAARQRLEQSSDTLERIAVATGFGSSINLRRPLLDVRIAGVDRQRVGVLAVVVRARVVARAPVPVRQRNGMSDR